MYESPSVTGAPSRRARYWGNCASDAGSSVRTRSVSWSWAISRPPAITSSAMTTPMTRLRGFGKPILLGRAGSQRVDSLHVHRPERDVSLQVPAPKGGSEPRGRNSGLGLTAAGVEFHLGEIALVLDLDLAVIDFVTQLADDFDALSREFGEVVFVVQPVEDPAEGAGGADGTCRLGWFDSGGRRRQVHVAFRPDHRRMRFGRTCVGRARDAAGDDELIVVVARAGLGRRGAGSQRENRSAEEELAIDRHTDNPPRSNSKNATTVS